MFPGNVVRFDTVSNTYEIKYCDGWEESGVAAKHVMARMQPSVQEKRAILTKANAAKKAAKEAGYELKIGKFPFSASGKASASGHKDGFIKVIFDAKYGELLGTHMIGSNVTEMIAEAVIARKLETTGYEILKTVHPHPTLSEAFMEATAAAYGEVIHL